MPIDPYKFTLFLYDFYYTNNKSKIDTLPVLLEKSKGKEEFILQGIEKKYNIHIDRSLPISKHYDFASKEFIPELALLVDLKIDYSTTTIYDNISKCAHLLPKNDPNYMPEVAHHPQSSASKSKLKVVNTVKDIAEKYSKGPFMFLYNSYIHHKKIKVITRRIDGLRGSLTGYLKAYDKHMNLILQNVYEEWTQKVPQLMNEQSFEECTEDSEHSYSPRKTTFSKDDEQYFIDSSIQKQCSSIQQLHYKEIPMKRYLKNLFVRGDMVVVIYNVDYQ